MKKCVAYKKGVYFQVVHFMLPYALCVKYIFCMLLNINILLLYQNIQHLSTKHFIYCLHRKAKLQKTTNFMGCTPKALWHFFSYYHFLFILIFTFIFGFVFIFVGLDHNQIYRYAFDYLTFKVELRPK